ncbi:unnamed protein product [Parajaminaea phylloscopi]
MAAADPIPIASASASRTVPTNSADSGDGVTGSLDAASGRPRSLRSVSSSGSTPPNLENGSLALLAQFQADRAKQEARFARLQAKARAQEKQRNSKANGRGEQSSATDGTSGNASADTEEEESFAESEAWNDLERLAKLEAGIEVVELDASSDSEDGQDEDGYLSVDDWRQLVAEDFQQSQFWYSTPFAYTLADLIAQHLKEMSAGLGRQATVAFVCSPTAFVAFQHRYGVDTSAATAAQEGWKSGTDLWMLEIDERFKVAAKDGGFVKYDFNTPLKGLGEMRGCVDMVVIDPPFLNEKTTKLVAETVRHILLPSRDSSSSSTLARGGSILLLTGDQIADFAARTYPLPGQPDLVRTQLDVQHDGGRLSNRFGAWASWPGAQQFGASTATA